MTSYSFENDDQWATLKLGITALAKKQVLARFKRVSAKIKQDGSLLTEADTQMQIHSQVFLERNWPKYAFLGEESSLEEQTLAMESKAGCWILDPVDGTSNFAIGIPIYAVSLGLMIQGEIVAGLVYDPSHDEMFAARKGFGAE